MPRRPIVLALLLAVVTTGAVLVAVQLGTRSVGSGASATADQASGTAAGRAAVGSTAPPIAGTTLDGATFDLASFAGKPVVINFWGPSCVPCRDEFPLFEAKLAQHAAEGLTVVGVLTDDPVDPARAFVRQYDATWPTVVDPDKAIKTAYRVVARPQSYFVDRGGVIRSIQVGELTDADFERQFGKIAS